MTIVIFLVAGMSSRFGGIPKQMCLVGPNNETLIEYSVNQALQFKFSKLVFVTNKITEYLFINLFGNRYRDVDVVYIEQKYDKEKRKRPWGTTDAICSVINDIDEDFIMLNGDDIYGVDTFKKGYNLMKEKDINIIGGLKVIKTLPESGTVNRGLIYISENKVVGLKEVLGISKKDNPELHYELANVNFIGLQKNILIELEKILNDFKNKNKDDAKIECLLPDNLDELIRRNILNLKFFEINNPILGITNPGDDNILRKKLLNF